MAVLLPEGQVRSEPGSALQGPAAVQRLVLLAGQPDATEQQPCDNVPYVFTTWGDLTYGHLEGADAPFIPAFWILSATDGGTPALPKGILLAGGLDVSMTRQQVTEQFSVRTIDDGIGMVAVDLDGVDDDYRVTFSGTAPDATITRVGPYEPCA